MRRVTLALLAVALVGLAVAPSGLAQGPGEGEEGTSRAPQFVQDLLSSISCMLSKLVGWVPVVGDAFGSAC